MHRKNLFFLETIRNSRGTLAFLLGLTALRALLLAGACYAAAMGMDGVFLRGKGFLETAPVLLVLLLLLVLQPAVRLLQSRMELSLATSTRTRVRGRLHERLLSTDASARFTGRLLPLALEQTDALGLWFTRVLPVLLGLAASLPLLLLIAAWTDPWTGLLMLVTLPIAPFLLYLIGRVTRKASEKEWQELTELSSGFAELLRALPTLKLFRQEKRMGGRMRQLSEDFATAALHVLQLSFFSAFALELITTLSIAMIAVSIGLRLLYGQLSFLPAFFVLLLAPEFYQPLRQAGTAFHSGMTAMTAENALASALNPESSFADDKASAPDDRYPGNLLGDIAAEKGTSSGHIADAPVLTVENLSFTYPGSPLPAICDLSFSVPQGGITVLMGPSGSGKTTLLKLCAGLLTPSSGSLQWTDAGRAVPRLELFRTLSYVPQEPHLFNASLADNVSLAFDAEENGAQAERITKALHLAGMQDFLRSLPHGLRTRLGEGGQGLSQGQRKRLGLARALYQGRLFVLLDEPTAALDAKTAAEIRAILQELAVTHTLLIVTHDEAIRALARQVIELEPSERPENGTPSIPLDRMATDGKQERCEAI